MITPFRFITEPQVKTSSLNTLLRVQSTLCLSDPDFSNYLEVNPQQFETIKAGMKSIPLLAFAKLAERLNLNLEDLYHGRVDYPSLGVRFRTEPQHLPEKYSAGAGSRFATVINILDYVEEKYGWHKRIETLRHFQMSEDFLSAPERPVNFRFMTHLLTYLDAHVMPETEFFRIGQNTLKILDKSNLLKPSGNPSSVPSSIPSSIKDAYEFFFKDTIRFIDCNYIYTLEKLTRSSCVVSLKPNPAVSEPMEWKAPGSFGTCIYRAGSLSIVPRYLGKSAAHVLKTKCVHQGETSCEYHLTFSDA